MYFRSIDCSRSCRGRKSGLGLKPVSGRWNRGVASLLQAAAGNSSKEQALLTEDLWPPKS